MNIRYSKVLLASGALVVALLGGCGSGQTPGASDATVGPAMEHEADQSATVTTPVPEQDVGSAVGMANPASEYCIQINGTLDIVQGESGEIGMCHLPDGTVIEEWELYRRDNAQSEPETSQ